MHYLISNNIFLFKCHLKRRFYEVLSLMQFWSRKAYLLKLLWINLQGHVAQHNNAQHIDTCQNENQQNDTRHTGPQYNDTKHNDTQHNDTQHNDTQHNYTQHNDSQNSNTQHSDNTQ
jgi:hypothetical protein